MRERRREFLVIDLSPRCSFGVSYISPYFVWAIYNTGLKNQITICYSEDDILAETKHLLKKTAEIRPVKYKDKYENDR